jgi:lipid-A-disaccharide synthase
MSDETTKTIFISACEPSADLHCANLIEAIRQSDPSVEFVGFGGDKMEAAGGHLLENTVENAAMIYNVFKQLGYYRNLLRSAKTFFHENVVDLTIVCDSPAFNFHIARIAKRNASQTLFYVAPQLWAWAPWRIKKLKRRCDRLACILPFENDWFARQGMDVEFVGNPLFDEMDINVDKNAKIYSSFEPGNATIALIPGSRDAEIETLWPAMQQIALRIKDRWRNCKFLVSAASDAKLDALTKTQIPKFECGYVTDDVAAISAAADFAIVASGSATLQVAAAGCPMIIMYQSNRLMWHLIGKWLIRTRFLSLVNILARKALVPEYMPYFTSIEPIFQKCSALLANNTRLTRTSRELLDLVMPMKKPTTAAENVAKIALEMISD